MDYKAQYKDPRWQKKRLEILERDKFTCRACGNKEKTLHVHHSHYEKGLNIWDDDYTAHLYCLCEDCHGSWHQFKNDIDYCISLIGVGDNFKDLGFLYRYISIYTNMLEDERMGLISFVKKRNKNDKNDFF